MAIVAKDIIKTASLILNDAGAVRWTPQELATHLSAGMIEIAVLKPNATSKTIEMNLQRGTYQVLPNGYQAILQINRNLVTLDASPDRRGGGRAITPVTRETIDAAIPDWHNDDVLPYQRDVTHVVDHMSDQRAFYVVPGNDGTGVIEAVVSAIPEAIPIPTNPLDIDGYTTTLDVQDIYKNALLDYVLYRAFSKDVMIDGAAQRAQIHYGQFANALGIKSQAEAAQNINTSGRT